MKIQNNNKNNNSAKCGIFKYGSVLEKGAGVKRRRWIPLTTRVKRIKYL
jgi:hypothetical protein